MDYKSVYLIYEETLNSLCHNKNNWLQLLDCISNNYLYSFYEQVLIYAQKPTAQAVKEIGKWNDANRYVNKGTKGIALLAEKNGYPYLKYVFDMDDTNSKLKRKVNFWTIPFSFENDLISSLQFLNESNIPFSTLSEAIISSSKVVSSLQDNDVLSSSTAYVVLKRCNLNPEDYIDYNIFNSINRNDIVKLGVEVSNNSKTLLYLIYQEIQNIKEKEIDKIYIFENNLKTLYDVNNERSNDYENDLQKSWQLPNTEYNSANSKESTRKILNNEVKLSETEQPNLVSRNDDVGRTKPTFDRGSNNSGAKVQRIDTNSNGTREHHRRNEAEKSNEVGTKNESNKSDGRGNDNSRIDLQLNNNENGNSDSLFVSDKKQLSLFANSEETILSEKEIITNHNFRLEQVEYNSLTDTEKFKNNIEAIKVLKLCEKENRLASIEEQNILVKYIGWGGLSRAFEENSVWSKELKNLLNDEEYNSAMESTLTSFYTSPMIVQAIYKVFLNANIKVGKILEPSCGIGNFFGLIPDEFQNSKMYGVEIDNISSRIAKKLYPNVNIINSGYEDTNFKNDFFDIAIGNIPFSDYKVNDKNYNNLNSFIHDYFFIKSLDKVRMGGIIAFITTKGTMDKESLAVRKYIAQRANLLGAIRLPDNIFNNAGTRVTTDIIFLQKREFVEEINSDWIYLDTDVNGIKINKYYVEHPDMVCGTMIMETSQFGMKSACKMNDSSSFEKQLNNAISKINIDLSNYKYEEDINNDELDLSFPAEIDVRNFSYVLVDDNIYFYENGKMYPKELKIDTQNRIKHLIEIRDCTRLLIDYQVNNYSDEDIKKLQGKLNVLYDNFVKKFGLINSRNNSSAFSDDSSFYLLCSLEIL